MVHGLTPELLRAYNSFHARSTHHVVSQKIYVSAAVAQRAAALAKANGPAADAQCALTTSRILQQLPGFGHISTTYFPAKLMDQFARIPGVTTSKYYETDVGQN